MKKIKIILMLIFVAFNLCVKAQTIGYTYKALAAEGCSIKYSVTKQDSVYYIISGAAASGWMAMNAP